MTFGKCVYGKQDQVAYAYGEMGPEEAEAFRNHLASCPRCLQAVSELAEAAALCRGLRDQPAPEVGWQRSAPTGLDAPPPRKPEGPRPLVWMPAGTALAALIVVVAVVALCQPIRRQDPGGEESARPGPGSPREQKVAAPAAGTARQPARAAVRGKGRILRAGAPAARRFERVARLGAGDVLDTREKDRADVALPDGSHLELAAASSLRVDTLASPGEGDRLELLRGRVECRVAPRSPRRPFSVAAGPGVVTVKGTRFVVHLDRENTLTVGVLEGAVELTPRADPAAARTVRAGSQATLTASSPVRLGRLDLAARLRLFAGGAAGTDDHPGQGSGNTGAAQTEDAAEGAAGRDVAGQGTMGDGTARRTGTAEAAGEGSADTPQAAAAGSGDAVADWAQGVGGHSSLFFDAFRAEMRAGRFEDALRKIENYLSDPESPDRPEAVYLRVVCLEQLGRRREAARACRGYLERWPGGSRVAEVRAALLRLAERDPQD